MLPRLDDIHLQLKLNYAQGGNLLKFWLHFVSGSVCYFICYSESKQSNNPGMAFCDVVSTEPEDQNVKTWCVNVSLQALPVEIYPT